jgi:asparagine synthase (glutamine-hydrolysing)
MPAGNWGDFELASLLDDKCLAHGERYHEYRTRPAAAFFFSADQRQTPAARLAAWDSGGENPQRTANDLADGIVECFSRHPVHLGCPPDWHRNWITGERIRSDLHWCRLNEFSQGDVKLVWEPNRFSFVYALVRAYRRRQDERYPELFWQWVESWRQANPPNHGVNWKCGQEISFRVLAWCFGLYGFLRSPATTPGRITMLAEMMAASGRRIAGNVSYALSQQNNHPISEGVGLWTLGLLFPEFREASEWRSLGRRILEQQARELIYDDGSFSQSSTNYHRVMLHDYLWAIQLGRCNGMEFEPEVLDRVRRAGQWLLALMDSNTGRVANLGANDGALVLPLSDCGYLDFRPTVQAVGAVLDKVAWLPGGPWDELPAWLGAEWSAIASPSSREGFLFFPDGGYAVHRDGEALALFRCPPRFRHRPAHCDLLHFDLWLGPTNVLRDSGTYSYNCAQPWQDYFSSTSAHNTVQFDGRDQMPRISRFLFGQWPALTVENRLQDVPPSMAAEFVDWQGGRHQRIVTLTREGYRITDRIRGYHERAVLRWRLAPEWTWELHGDECRSAGCTLRVTASPGPVALEMATGCESLHYFEKTALPVLHASVTSSPQELTTEIRVRP